MLLNCLCSAHKTKIKLFGSDGVMCVWMHPGEMYEDNCPLTKVKHGDGSMKLYKSFISIVSHEKISQNICKIVRGVLISVTYCL